jgi:hypothetical protein
VKTVKQLAINGPAKGKIFERPISEVNVYLPWDPPPVEYVSGAFVHLPLVIYLPHEIKLFGRSCWVLSVQYATDELANDALFERFASEIAKEIVVPSDTIILEKEHDGHDADT